LAALLGVWGCGPDPDLVYVDLDAVDLRESRPAGGGYGFDTETYSLEQTVPPLGETDVFFGSAEERAVAALQVYQQAQREAAQAVLERLRKAYLVEAEQSVAAQEKGVEQDYQKWLDEAVEGLYELFVQYAAEIEPVRYELTQIVGFPDPDPRSLKVPLESNEKAYKSFLRARTLREQIIALEAEYEAEVERRLGALQAARDARLAALATTADELRSDALRRAQAEAEKVTQDARTVLEASALDPEARLPAVPGASASVNSGPVSVVPTPGAPGLRETREDVEAQLHVFLKTYRYRRTRDATLGRNATQEFLEWRRKYMAGP
jgi:hypothetical protein